MDDDSPSDEKVVGSGAMSEPIEELSLDTIFDLLSHNRRREVLSLLMTREQALTVRDLTHGVARAEAETEIPEIPQERVEDVAISLHHVHIPKLVETGVVTYDDERRIVEPTENLGQFEPFLTRF